MRMTMTPEQFQGGDETGFEAALQDVLSERVAGAPQGLEQRLLARLAQAAELAPEALSPSGSQAAVPNVRPAASSSATQVRQPFAFVEIGRAKRSASSVWTALGIHGAAIALIAFVIARHVGIIASPVKPAMTLTDLSTPPPPPPPAIKAERMGGGGGQHDLAPVTQGHLPKFAPEQILKPTQAPKIQPKLAVEPTINVQDNLKMANNNMVNIGMPNSNLSGVSLGNGSGTGIGSGNGNGLGPGSGGNTGGGVYHVGGSVRAPALIFSPDPEFSEEARKAKFSGNVEVYLWVDENGNPSHVKVVRGVGMGLDEKAMEAVRQYKFRPATQNGKPVKVDLYVEVNFQIF